MLGENTTADEARKRIREIAAMDIDFTGEVGLNIVLLGGKSA